MGYSRDISELESQPAGEEHIDDLIDRADSAQDGMDAGLMPDLTAQELLAPNDPGLPEHMVVVDGSNMLRRAWSVAKPKAGHDGRDLGASELFGMMLRKLVRRMCEGAFPPSHLVVFFDPPREDSWRREIFDGYKADRSEMEPALAAQIPVMKAICDQMGIAHATAEKHEADDMIAAYVEDAVKNGMKCSIISSDKDLMQLIRPGVKQLHPVTDKWFGVKQVEEKFEVPPDRLGDYLALAGDSVDGVPGAPGIGPKAAVALIGQFPKISHMLRDADQVERAGWRKILKENKPQIRLSKALVALDAEGAPRLLSFSAIRAPSLARAHAGFMSWRDQNF